MSHGRIGGYRHCRGNSRCRNNCDVPSAQYAGCDVLPQKPTSICSGCFSWRKGLERANIVFQNCGTNEEFSDASSLLEVLSTLPLIACWCHAGEQARTAFFMAHSLSWSQEASKYDFAMFEYWLRIETSLCQQSHLFTEGATWHSHGP